ncbi:MAG: hypothetical protein Q9181_002240 [Wetmoreana brouardii]
MTQPLLRPPTNLQPRSKANPTSSSTSVASQVTVRTPQQSRAPSENRQSTSTILPPAGAAFDRATATLIRRALCFQQTTGANDLRSIEELLPPLTSSNEVDSQLYAIIAIVVKELVLSWYGKITPDQTFVEEVVRIIAHCTRALEGRLRKVDLEVLLFDEIAELIETHVLVYHSLNPHPALSPVPDPLLESSITQQLKNEGDYRQQLVQGALAVLLPTEDLENVCLRTLVADVFAETILGNSIGGRVCEGWFIWTSIAKLVEAVKASMSPRATGEEIEVDTRSRLEKFGLLSERGDGTRPAKDGNRRSAFSEVFWRGLQYGYLMVITLRFVVVGLFAASSEPRRSSWSWKAAAADSPNAKPTEAPAAVLGPMLNFKIFSLVSTMFDMSFRMPWLSGSLALLQHHLVRSPLALLRVGAVDGLLDHQLALSWHHPKRPVDQQRRRGGAKAIYRIGPPSFIPSVSSHDFVSSHRLLDPRTLLCPLPALSTQRNLFPESLRSISIIDIEQSNQTEPGNIRHCPKRYPAKPLPVYPKLSDVGTWWYLAMPKIPQATAGPMAPLYIRHLLHTHILRPSFLPPLLAIIRTNLFPRNALPSRAPEPPTPEQQRAIKRHCAEAASSLLPDVLSRAAGLSRADLVLEIECELDVWSDAYLNKHLAYSVLELVIVRLLPEMGEKGVRELMEMRGV